MTKWEYKMLKDPTEFQLNELGADGWEICGTISSKHEYQYRVIFKRQQP
jgi:hypothetical protein